MKKWVSRLLLMSLCLGIGLVGTAYAADRVSVAAIPESIRPCSYIDPDMRVDELVLPPPQPDGEFPIAQGGTDFYHPSIAPGGMVVWYAHGSAGMDVMGLLLGADGVTPGEDRLIAGGPGDQMMPFVASDTEHGGYLVVWHDQRADIVDIYGRYLDTAGRPQGDVFAVSTANGDQLRPTAAYVPAADAFLVVWQDSRTSEEPDIYGRLVPTYASSSSGGGTEPLGKEWAITSSRGGQYIPTVTCEAARTQCLVVWQDDRRFSSLFTDVMAQLVDADPGAAIGDEIDVAVGVDYQYSPVVVFNPVSDEYLVVWDDDISARRLSLSGRLLGDKISISLESPYQYKPAVAVMEDGTYLIVWEDLRNLGARGADIYGQWLSTTGLPLGSNLALSTDRHNQYSPAMVAGAGWGPGDFVVIWEDDRASDTTLSLYGEWLSRSDGGP
jgi:hypothetical protein